MSFNFLMSVKVEIVIFPAGWVFKLINLSFTSNLFKYTIVPWFNFTLFVTINLYCMKPAYKIKKSIRLEVYKESQNK